MQNDLDVLTLQELVKRARTNLPDSVWDYVSGASETETTMKRNRMGIDRLALVPRVLEDVSSVDCSGTMLGRKTRMPVFLAPIGSIQQVHAPGATTGARAAGSFGIYSFLSSVTDPDMETVAREAPGPKIFQLYVRGDRAWMAEIVRRAVDSGYDGFCLTVDTAMYSRRERDILKRHVPTGRLRSGGFEFQAALNWDDVKWFKDSFDIPLVIKGIATAEDAILAAEHGVEVVYISNHGGRQLDHGRGAIEVLPEVVAALGGRAKVYIDGGFMRGTDIAKALALGAEAVGIGRLFVYGLAAWGEAGVLKALELLEDEFRIALGLCGVTAVDQLDASYVRPARPVRLPHVASALPLIDIPSPRY